VALLSVSRLWKYVKSGFLSVKEDSPLDKNYCADDGELEFQAQVIQQDPVLVFPQMSIKIITGPSCVGRSPRSSDRVPSNTAHLSNTQFLIRNEGCSHPQ
jgi:hypothetical protein